VSYNSGFVSAITGAPIAYSTVSHEFLVVWRAYF
jgi:hypothetical protein